MRDWLKRAIDVGGALAALVILAPVMAAVALTVRLRLGRPVLFRQIRVGRGESRFELVKFRTMTDERGPDGQLLPDGDRLTPFGSWLRSTSLDELPELWCVLIGEMSFVGPRPLPTKYLDRYRFDERRRHDVRPGITGWAQVNGRNAVGWDERLALDVWYVANRNLRLDLRILFMTLAAVIRRDGISEDGEATMTELPADR